MKRTAFTTTIIATLVVAVSVFTWADRTRAAVDRTVSFHLDRTAKTTVPDSFAERFGESRFQQWRDKFPALDKPPVVEASEADFLRETDLVIGFEINGEARAYPVLVASYHHVINDDLGGQPLTIATCGVCSSAAGFDPRMDGRTLNFRFDGIWQGMTVMYDRETESRWHHLTGACVKGARTGQSLRKIPCRYVHWSEWKKDYLETTVVKPQEGVPYLPDEELIRGDGGYPRGFGQTIQDRSNLLRRYELVYGLEIDGNKWAFPFGELLRLASFVTNQQVGDRHVVVGVNGETGSAFGFDATIESMRLVFHDCRGGEIFATDGSVFNQAGVCTRGPLQGKRLKPLTGIQAEWYGWYATHPGTNVWDLTQHCRPVHKQYLPTSARQTHLQQQVLINSSILR